jgi:hypothetical protein
MKHQTSVIIATLALAAASLAQAQNTNWLSETRLTIALKISRSTPGIAAKDEAGVVITPKNNAFSNYYMDAKGAEINEGIATITESRFSNLELLRHILKMEVRNGIMKSVVGWSLVYIGDDDDAIQSGFYIKRKIRGGKFQIINVNSHINNMDVDVDDDGFVAARNERSVYNPENDTYTRSDTYSDFGISTLSIVGGAFPFYEGGPDLNLTGSGVFSDTWNSGKYDYETTSVNLSPMIGKYLMRSSYDETTQEQDYSVAIVHGALTGAKSTFITQDSFDQGSQQSNNAP